MSGVRVHKKYGVNPVVPLCFWCQKPRNEVVLLGAGCHEKAPGHVTLDYEPCDECAQQFAAGIWFIEARPDGKNPPMSGGAHPTGNYWVVRREAVPRMISEPSCSTILERGRCFVTRETAVRLGLYPGRVRDPGSDAPN